MSQEEVLNYQRILEAVPTNVPAYEALKKIFTEGEQWDELAKLVLERAARLPDREQAPDLYLQAASIFLEKMDDVARAKASIAKVLESDSSNRAALALWRKIAVKEEDFATVVKLLRQETQITEDPKEKSRLFLDIAKLFSSKLNNKEHAAVAFHQSFLLDNENLDAMKHAVEHYQEVGEWQRVIAVLRSRLESCEEPKDKASTLARIARAFAHLDEGQSAEGKEKTAQLFKEALSIDENCEDAKLGIEELADELDDWSTVLKRLKREIRKSSSDSDTAAFLNYRIADGYYRREGKPAYAIRYCKQAIELVQDHGPSQELLQKLYASLRKWEALADFLSEQARNHGEAAGKVQWLKKLANVYREHTKERSREIDTLEQILDVLPGENEALESLEGIYREDSRFGKALEVMEKRLVTLEEPLAQKILLSEMASLAREELRRNDKAAVYFEKILDLDPDDSEALDALAPLYESEASWEKLIDVMQMKQERCDTKEQRAYIYREIGDVYSQKLSLSKEAFESYTLALRENPQDEELTPKLEALARQIGNWSEMIKLYQETLDNADEPGDQAAMLVRIGDVYDRELNNRAKARSSYEEALEQHPNLEAMNALQRIYSQSEDWVDLAELLKEKSSMEELLELPERIEVLQELARIQHGYVEDQEGAAEAYEKILALDPSNTIALGSLERLYKETENWDSLRTVYQHRIEDPSSEAELKSTLHMLGTLLIEKLELKEEAVVVFQQLRVLEPQNNLILSRLEELYRFLEQWENWVETARYQVEHLRRPEQKKEVLFEVASIQEEELEDNEGAIATLRELHELDASESRTLDELERLLDESEDREGLLEVLRKKADISNEPDFKKELLYRMAELYRTEQQQAEMAAAFKEILEIDSTELKANRALQGFYQLEGEHGEVLSLLTKERDAVEDDEAQFQLSQRIAQLHSALGHYDSAIGEYQKILALQPEDEVAQQALQTIASENIDWRADAFLVLEPIFRDSQNWESLVVALEARFESTADKSHRLEMAREIEELYRLRLSDDENAFLWCARLLREDFEDPDVRERVELMADEMEKWNDLLSIYKDIVRTFTDREQIVSTYLFIAQSYQDQLGELEEALKNFRHVLDYSSQNEEAIDALEILHRQLGHWRDLVDVLRMRTSFTEGSEEKKELLLEVAEIWEQKLEDLPEAIQVYCDIRELEKDDLTAIQRLAALYEKEARYNELADTWHDELALLEDSEEQVSLRYRLGIVYSDHLRDQERALELFQKVLAEDPEQKEAIQRVEALSDDDLYRLTCARILEPIYQHQNDFSKLRSVYKVQLEDKTQSAEERRGALMRLGLIHEEKLNEFKEAFERYLQVFKEAPGHLGARDALHRMSAKLNLWPEFAKAMETGVGNIRENEERVQTHLVLADTYRTHLSNPDKGMSHDRIIVDELDTKNLPAIQALDSYYTEREEWNDLIAILFQKERALEDNADKKGVFDRVAGLYEEKLNDNSQAILILNQYLMRLEGSDGVEEPGAAELEEAKSAHEASEKNVEEFVAAVDVTREALETLEQQASEGIDAISELSEKLESDPENEELQAERDKLSMLAEAVAEARDVKSTELAELVEALDAAELAETEASEQVVTAESTRDNFAEELEKQREQHISFQLDTIQSLVRLYEVETRWADLVEILGKEVELTEDDEEAIKLRFRVASLWEERLEDTPKSIELYRSILDDDPDFEPAFEAMERLSDEDDYQLMVAQSLESYFREGRQDWVRLIQMVEIQLAHTEDKMRRLNFLKEIVELYEDELDNTDMAFVYLCRAFGEAPTDRDIISELERLAEENDAWEELVGVYEDAVERIEDEQLALRMYLKIANIFDEALLDTEEAILNYQNALKIERFNSAALGALDRLYRQDHEWEQLVDILQRKVSIAEESRDQINLWSRIANVWERELDDMEQAVTAYQKILEIDENNYTTLSALLRLYEDVENWYALYDICLRKSEQSESVTEQSKLWKKMAELCAGPLERPDESIELYEKVLENNERDEESLDSLEKLYAQAERWDDLVQVVQRLLLVANRVGRKKELYRTLGRTYGEHLGMEEESVKGWQKVLDLDPKDPDALGALRFIHEKQENWEELVNILRRLIPLQVEDPERLELYLQLASIYQEKMDRQDEAIASWRRVLEIDPTHWRALETLEVLLTERSDWRSVLGIIEKKEVVVEEFDQKIELLLRAAKLCTDELKESNRATPYFERILTFDPRHFEAVSALETSYKRNQNWKKLINVYDLQVGMLDTAEEKVEKLQSIADIYENRLFNKTDAFQVYVRAFQSDPMDTDVRDQLERIADETDRWREVVEVYSRQVERIGSLEPEVAPPSLEAPVAVETTASETQGEMDALPPEVQDGMDTLPPEVVTNPELDAVAEVEVGDSTSMEQAPAFTEAPEEVVAPSVSRDVLLTPEAIHAKVTLLMRIGYIFQTELREDSPAIEAYERVISLDDSYISAIEALEELYDANERWDSLIGVQMQKLQVTEVLEEQRDILYQVAKLQEHRLEDRPAAIQSLRQVQVLYPDEQNALTGLERLYRNEGLWPDLIEILERRVDQSAEMHDVLKMRFEIGRVYGEHLEQPQLAVDAYRGILELDSSNFEALQELEKLFTELERWDDLLEVLVKEVALCKKDTDKVPYYYRMAIIWEDELHDPSMAIDNLKRILSIDRWNLSAIKGLEKLYRVSEDWEKLIEVYEQHIRAVDDLEQMAELYFEIGSIYENHQGETERAVTYYQRVLDADPTFQGALSALGRLYEAAGNWPKCIEMMEREAQVANEPELLVEVYFRIGKLYEERLVQIDRAKDSYRRALEISPSYLPAIRSLKVIHFLQRDWDGVIRLASQQERFTEDLEEKASIACEIGKLYRDRLSNLEQAAAYYQKALEIAPSHLDAAHPLAELYIDQKEWVRAEAVLDMLLPIMVEQGATEELFRFHYLAALAAENQDNIQKALHHYQESYNLDSTFFPTLNGLGRIYYTQELWDRSLKVYQTILYHHQNQLSEREISEVYCRMGMAYDRMGVLEQAIDYYERALDIDPANPLAIRQLAGYAEQQGDWNRSLELKERLLLILDSEDERFELAVELGNLCYDRLREIEQAVDFFRQASLSKPEDKTVLYKLLELYEETQNWEEMIEILEQLSGLEEDPEQQVGYLFNIAEIYQNRLNEVDSAIEFYNRALDQNPAYEAAFQAIETLLFGLEMWQKLEQNYQAMLRRLPQDDQQKELKVALWRKLGELHRYKLENIDNAITAYELVYQLEPETKNLEELAELYGQSEAYRPKAVEAHHELLSRNPARIESYRALVRIYYELQKYDRSFILCSVLRFLGDVSAEEEQFYKSMKAKASDRIKRAFREEDTWKGMLFHPLVRTPLAEILAILYQFCGADFAQRTKDFKIRKADKVDPNLFFSRTYDYVSQILGLTGREVYQTTLFPSLRVVNTFPPVILGGEDMFKERHPKELLFMTARQITFSRPEFLFASILPHQQFRAMLSTFFSLYVPNFPVEANEETAERIRAIFQKSLPNERREQLGQLVQTYVQDPDRIQPDQYLEGVEHTANRVGFCLSGELKIASAVMEREVREDFQVAHRSKVKELVLFSLSQDYFEFRETQGLAVKL